MRASSFVRVAAAGAIVLSLFAPWSSARAQSTEYTVTDIGTLVGTGDGQFDSLTNVAPTGINGNGVVIANAAPPDDTFWSIPFTSDDGKVRRLGKEKAFSFASGINDEGEVVGHTTTLEDTPQEFLQAVVWRDRKAIVLPSLGGDRSNAVGINNEGDIVGLSALEPGSDAPYHAVLWQNDEAIDLGTLGGELSAAEAINDEGVVVGRSQAADRPGIFPFVWEEGTLTELSTPDDRYGDAFAINDDGIIAGVVIDAQFNFYAVRWIDEEPSYLPTFGEQGTGAALGVNGSGQIVGYSASANDPSVTVAVLWEGDTVVDLNTLIPAEDGYVLESALAINDAGQIAALGAAEDGTPQGLLLTPVDSDTGRTTSTFAAVQEGYLRQNV